MRPDDPARNRGRAWLAVAALLAPLLAPLVTFGAGARHAVAAPPSPPVAVGLQPIVPYRLADTRETPSRTPLGPGQVLTIPVLGRGGIPASGVESVALNVAVTEPTGDGYFTVWPSTAERQTTATLNFVAGQTVGNAAVVGVGPDGAITVYNYSATAHLVVDATGWFPTGRGLHAVNPDRLLDTRTTGAPLGPGQTTDLRVVDVGGVPAEGVTAVVLNVAVTEPSAPGYVTVFPAGRPRPVASSGNFAAGQTASNNVIAKVGDDGKVSIFNYQGSTHVVVDVSGYFTASSGYVPLTPLRIADTRDNSYAPARNKYANVPVPAGCVNTFFPCNPVEHFDVTQPRAGASTAGLPFGPGAVVLNVAVTSPSHDGFLTVWPTGAPRPTTANLNFVAGQTTANTVIVGTGSAVGPRTSIDVFVSSGSAHVVIDIIGYFPADGLGLLRLHGAGRSYSSGTDLFGVVFCEHADVRIDAAHRAEALTTLRTEVRAYFDWLSEGRYDPQFVEAGSVTIPVLDEQTCLDAVRDVPVPQIVTGVLGITALDPAYGCGFTASGYATVGADGPGGTYPGNRRVGAFTSNAVIGPDACPTLRDYGTAVHEIGHMLDFPHSYVGGADEYSNVLDVMSNLPSGEPQGTVAINRFRAGWLDPAQVAVHATSGASYSIRPIGSAGTQMVVVPGDRPERFTTLETRVGDQYDAALPAGAFGVAVHVVDIGACTKSGQRIDCPASGMESRIAPAAGAPDSTTHVLQEGETLTLGDVTISVTEIDGGRHEVTITGLTYAVPDLG